jgi:phosphatidate phosphatase APP1
LALATTWGAIFEFLSRWLPKVALRRDDCVVIFPTAARLREDGSGWELPIHGWVHRPGRGDLLRKAFFNALLGWLDLDAAEGRLLENRLGWFLVDNKRARLVTLRVGDRQLVLGPTDPQGHFHGKVQLSIEAAAAAARNGWLELEVCSAAHPPRAFLGKIRLLEPTGLSIISDLDDTVKISNVLDRRELLRSTLLRPFEAVPQMAERYRSFVEHGAAIHFVSCSPWHLWPAIETFLREAGFPDATMICKRLRLKDSSLREFLSASLAFKVPRILELIDRFPRRRYLLVGDSGESDPEIYGQVARERPDNIVCVLIRRVKGADARPERWTSAFRGVDPHLWQLFEDPREVEWSKWA